MAIVLALVNGEIQELEISTGGVESRYEIFNDEILTVTEGRIMFQYGALKNKGFLINRGRIIEASN